jgi:hypothetical protein
MPPCAFTPVGSSCAHAEDEQPLPPVRRADFLRRKQSRRNSVAEGGEVGANSIEAESEVSGDVLEEHEARFNLAKDASDRGPKVPRIVSPTALAGVAERLARVAANDAIHDSAPRSAVEGVDIRPHRTLIHDTRSHRFDQVADGERFPLHHAHAASVSDCQLEPEVEPAASGAEAEDVDWFGT